ncbi:T9SS type A sorting domain-containing protein [Candidatus Poribacteria bacterium]|nr:T9SS type A sorting domain-containing protein [Candidatus Poribacteria bacterium]
MLWNLSPGIDKFTFSCAERDAKLLELREWVDRHAQDIIGGVNLPEFVLQIPKDYGLIHIPLKVTEVDCKAMELKTIGDAFDALGGAENVHFLITRDCPAGVWRSFLGEQHRGGLADRMLTDDMGIITVMKNPVTLHLKGEALGTDGVSAINLCRGINLVGVPLKDERLKRVGDLFRLAGCENKIAVIIVLDNGVFRVVARPDDPAGNIPITCGQSFIITAREACVAEIRGEAWDNVPNGLAAAPLMALAGHTVDGGTPVLAVHGAVIDEVTGTAKDGFRIIVKNRSTGAMLNTLSGGDPPLGSYSVTFVDVPQVERSETPIYRGRAARVGDILEITVESPSPLIGVQPLRHIVSTDDVKASQIRLPDLVAYRIPTETKLLPNYPNPFNPETWIPYRLAKDASVMLTIYDTTGAVVRTLLVGHQPAAVYESKDKAIYWDGRNDWGEQVASGVYFYTLRANDFTATRKMIILKSPQFDR